MRVQAWPQGSRSPHVRVQPPFCARMLKSNGSDTSILVLVCRGQMSGKAGPSWSKWEHRVRRGRLVCGGGRAT
jgi:hypothetical protein